MANLQIINNLLTKKNITIDDFALKIGLNCARHTFATLMLQASGNIAVVSKLLGHSNIATTQIYARVLEDEKKKAIRLMDGF